MEEHRSAAERVRGTASEVKAQIKTQVGGAADELARGAKEAADRAGASAHAEAERQYGAQQQWAAKHAKDVGDALQIAAEELERRDDRTLSSYTSRMASGLRDLSQSIESKSLDEVVHEVERFGREHPLALFAGSTATGFLLARLLARSGAAERTSSSAPADRELISGRDPRDPIGGIGRGSSGAPSDQELGLELPGSSGLPPVQVTTGPVTTASPVGPGPVTTSGPIATGDVLSSGGQARPSDQPTGSRATPSRQDRPPARESRH